MSEHPINLPIERIIIWHGNVTHDIEAYRVGFDGVTRIEACTKSGMHADIAYVRVWAGEIAIAEFCQHNIVGVYFGASP